jgi:hypothetical protein
MEIEPNTIADAISRGFIRGPRGDSRLAANGEPFKTFRVTVSVPDGEEETAYDDVLVNALMSAVLRNSGSWGEFPRIYWRQFPEFETSPESYDNYRVRMLRCRVLISGKGPT